MPEIKAALARERSSMLAILQLLEAKHAVECDLCRTINAAAGTPPIRQPKEDERRLSAFTGRGTTGVGAAQSRVSPWDGGHARTGGVNHRPLGLAS
jgi:hypothetical protein